MKISAPETLEKHDLLLGETLRETLPAEHSSAALRERVAQMAARADENADVKAATKPKRQLLARCTRFALGAVSVAFALLLFSIMWPRYMVTQAVAQVQTAIDNASSAHMTNHFVKNGKRTLMVDTWYQNDRCRIENHYIGRTELWATGRKWTYEAKTNKVEVSKSPPPYKLSDFNIESIVKESTKSGVKVVVTLLSDTHLNGQLVKRIQLDTNFGKAKVTIIWFIDKDSNLPLHADATIDDPKVGKSLTQLDWAYNKPLPPSLFEPLVSRPARPKAKVN